VNDGIVSTAGLVGVAAATAAGSVIGGSASDLAGDPSRDPVEGVIEDDESAEPSQVRDPASSACEIVSRR
jgi:hypothetical protein